MKAVNVVLEDNFEMPKRGRSRRDLNFFLAPILAAIGAAIGGTVIGAAGIYIPLSIGFFVSWSTVSAIIVGAVVVGLAVWSMTSAQKGKPGSGIGAGTGGGSLGGAKTVDQGGQLVNTRQSAKVLPVIYGIARVGCNWIFARPSSENNNILNVAVTWSEGEIEGLAQAIDYSPLFSGSGINDIHTGGEFDPTSICACYAPCYSHTGCSFSCDMTCYSTYA